MQDHWKHFGPPVYLAVAGYLGLIKERVEDKPSGSIKSLFQMFKSKGGVIQ